MALSQASNVGSSAVPPPFTPALLQSTWILPNAARASSTAAFRSPRSATLVRTKATALLPASVALALSRFGWLQSARTTFMPSDRKARTMPKPIPLAPPVMNATLSVRSCMPLPSLALAPGPLPAWLHGDAAHEQGGRPSSISVRA